MNWETILSLRAWTPLYGVVSKPETVLPGVYRVAENAYFVTQPYNRAFQQGLLDAPFVTMAIWAGSVKALKRCLSNDETVQGHAVAARPPDILLMGTNGKYGELIQHVPKATRTTAERAIYSNAGKFVHKIIELDRFRFCFLSQRIMYEEEVYAIEISLG